MDHNQLAAWIRQVVQANGFTTPTWETIPAKIMFAVTELNEACDAVRGVGPDPLAEELADTAIRLIDILGSVWPNQWVLRATEGSKAPCNGPLFRPIEELLWGPLSFMCLAAESWRHEKRDATKAGIELALREVYSLGHALGFDMPDQIHQKMIRNMERGRLHGKKRPEG